MVQRIAGIRTAREDGGEHFGHDYAVMDGDFGTALAGWNSLFSAVAGVSATLLGLLFVALGLNPRIMADDGPTGLRVWSSHTFHSFLVLLILGIGFITGVV